MYSQSKIRNLLALAALSLSLLIVPTTTTAAVSGCSVSLSGKKTFAQLQSAINSLPSSGGKVCLAKGMYISNSSSSAPLVTITKSNVTLEADGDALLANWSTSNYRDVISVNNVTNFNLKNISIVTSGRLASAIEIYNNSSTVTVRNAKFYVYGDLGKAISTYNTNYFNLYDSVIQLAGSSLCGGSTNPCSWGYAYGIDVSGGYISNIRNVEFHQSNDRDTSFNFYGGHAEWISNIKTFGRGSGIKASRDTVIGRLYDYTSTGSTRGTALELSYGAKVSYIYRLNATANNKDVVRLSYGSSIGYFKDSHLSATGNGSGLSLSREGTYISYFSASTKTSPRSSISSQNRRALDITYGAKIYYLNDVNINSTGSYGIYFFGSGSNIAYLRDFTINSSSAPIYAYSNTGYIIDYLRNGTLTSNTCSLIRSKVRSINNVSGCIQ